MSKVNMEILSEVFAQIALLLPLYYFVNLRTQWYDMENTGFLIPA
jgi:hypothetical protein